MRVRTVLQTLSMLLLVGGIMLIGAKPVAAQALPSDVSASVRASDPLHPTLHLKNVSGHACQLVNTAQGTVAITDVMQGGKVVQPLPIDSASDDDIGYLLKSQLQTVQPGQSVDISLPVYKISNGYVLRATTWSAGAGSFAAEYPIAKSGALQLALSYSVPITPESGAPVCGAVTASTIGGSTMARRIVLLAVIVLLLLAIVLLVLWWWRKQHRHRGKVVAAAIFVLLGLGMAWQHAPKVFADVIVPPELQATYDGCIATFNANSDITGPILRILNDPANHFEIVHTGTAGSDMTGRPNPAHPGGGIFTIYWNPDDHHRYAGTGGSPDACSVLYHELYHALDQLNGTFSRDDCAGSGIETKEVMATRAQNLLRQRLGLPQRSHYGNLPLPAGDCRAAPRPTSCTGSHCGGTTGDPHMLTFDGRRYDFQAAGEFIVARNDSGSFEVQARQEPWINSRLVAINTAVAFKVGKDRVEVHAGQTPTLVINGKKQMLAGSTLPDGGQVQFDQGVISATWKDGSVAYVEPVGTYGLTLSVQVSDELAGKVDGLLGDANGESKNDLHVRGSKEVFEPSYQKLYPKFADSWRVSDKSTLFTYDKGKNTASYTIHNFPDKPGDAKALPGYAAAEAVCKGYGITDPAILANCALDVAITGRPEFARTAAWNQTFTAGTNFGGTTWQLNLKNPGDSASVTFDAKAHEKVFVQIPQSTLPNQCGVIRILASDQHEISSGCIINGQGEIDGTVLPDDGTYTISLAPGGATGNTTVRLLRIADQQGTITPDGARVTARIAQPGVVSRFTFTANAGQRIYVAVPSSTLDSQCGVLRLLDTNNQEIASGCIINHVGNIDTVVAPASGQYTIVVDPSGTTVGLAQVNLVYPTDQRQSINIDGSTLTASLKKPGSIATFTFNANAGQRIFIDLPTSELPSQCGLLTLHTPDNSVIGSGCVINHVGNLNDDGLVLPVSGQYTIVLDPGGSDIGSTTVRLRSH